MTHDRTDADGASSEAAEQAVDPVDDAEQAGGAEQDEARSGRSKTSLVVAAGAAAVALIVAVVFGVLWWTTESSSEYELAQAREEVLDAGRQAVIAYSAFDYTKPEDYRAAQRKVSTDDFNKATERGWKPARDRIVQEKLSAQVEILDIGITKFDPQQGSAEVLAAVNVTNTLKGKKLSPVPLRLVTQLKKVGGAWKVDNFAPAPSIDASNGSE